MNLTYLMGLTRKIQNTLGGGGLAGVDVGEDADVSIIC